MSSNLFFQMVVVLVMYVVTVRAEIHTLAVEMDGVSARYWNTTESAVCTHNTYLFCTLCPNL